MVGVGCLSKILSSDAQYVPVDGVGKAVVSRLRCKKAGVFGR